MFTVMITMAILFHLVFDSKNQTLLIFSENKNSSMFENFRTALDGKNSIKFISTNNLKIMHFSPMVSENKKFVAFYQLLLI